MSVAPIENKGFNHPLENDVNNKRTMRKAVGVSSVIALVTPMIAVSFAMSIISAVGALSTPTVGWVMLGMGGGIALGSVLVVSCIGSEKRLKKVQYIQACAFAIILGLGLIAAGALAAKGHISGTILTIVFFGSMALALGVSSIMRSSISHNKIQKQIKVI